MVQADRSTDSVIRLRVLLAGADASVFRLALGALSAAFGIEHRRVSNPAELRDALQHGEWDVLLCDPGSAECKCSEVLALLAETGSDLMVIAVTEREEETSAAEMIASGARAVLGPDRLGRLAPIVRRELEDIRRRRLRELQALLQSSPDPMLVASADGKIRHVNRLLEDLLGYSAGELDGQPVELLVPEHLRARHAADRARYAKAPAPRPMGAGIELAARRKDGTQIPVEISLGPVRLGGAQLICCGLRDLRERVRAERLLRAILEGTAEETGEEFLRALVKNLAQALEVRYAFAGEFISAERARMLAFWNGTGYTEPFDYPLAGMPCSHVGAEGECVVRERAQQAFPEDAGLRKFGAESYFGIRIRSKSGAPLGLLAVMDTRPLASEVTVRTVMRIFAASAGAELERMRMTEALRRSEERFQRLFRDAPEVMTLVRPADGVFLDVNRAFEHATGYRREEVLGRTSAQIGLWDEPEARERTFRQLAGSGRVNDVEFALRRRDGALRRCLLDGVSLSVAGEQCFYFIVRDVTETRRAQEALRASEEQFRVTFERAPVGMALRGMDGRWLDVNPKLCEILGYTREEMLSTTSVDITPEDERAVAVQFNERMQRGELRTYSREKRYLRKDGTPVWVALTVNVVHGPDGRPHHLVSVIEDIAARKQAEEGLREQERVRDTLMHNLPGMVYRCKNDPQRTLEFASQGCLGLTGYAPEDFIGNRTLAYAGIIDEEDRDAVWSEVQAALGERRAFELQYRIRARDGARKWVWEKGRGVCSEAGELQALEGYITDITHRIRAEQVERESAARMALVADNVPAMIAYVDRDFRIQYANRQFAEFYGGRGAAAAGKRLAEFLGVAAFAAKREAIERALAGEVVRYDVTRRRHDGALRHTDITLVPHRENGGRVLGVYLFMLDVTESRRADEELRQRERDIRLISDNVPTMIAFVDAGLRYRYVNLRYARLFGRSPGEMIGLTVAEVIGEDGWRTVRPHVEAALAGQTVTYEREVRRGDGGSREILVELVPHRDETGIVTGIYALATDVTERRGAERAVREREAEIRLIADNLPAMICYIGRDYTYRYANRRYAEFYAGANASPEGRTLEEVLGEKTWPAVREQVDRALAGENLNYQAKRRRRSDGSLRDVDVSLIPHRDEAGRVLGVYTLILDVTRRRRAEEALHLRDRALESIVNSVMITRPTDKGQEIVYVNPAFERITGYAAAEVLGRNPRFLHGEDHEQPGVAALRVASREGREATALIRNYRKDGSLFWNELRVAPVRDEAGRVTHFIGVSSDVTERVRYQEEIERHANYDSLTGLPNRNLLNDRIAQVLAKSDRSQRPVAVVYLDLDNLKRINDSLGHAMGDQVIAAVGARLAGAVRTGDTVARVGGDEFVVVLADLKHEDDAVRVAGKMLNFVGTPLKVETHDFVLSASAGVALYPKDGGDAATLLRNADTALYRAKADGRECFRFFAAEMNERVVEFLKLEQDLRRALEAGEFRLQYQPIVNLADGETVGAEALIRWRKKDGSMVPPGEFIPVAEESGLIVPIGRWVLETAARQAAEWKRARARPLFVSVNLSARQFRDPKLIEAVRAALEGAQLDASLLKLEITETAVMRDVRETERWLGALKDLGVQLSIDDFGTGYSSLAYLKRFPIDSLKIDRSFVRDLPADRDDLAISRAVIDLARRLELQVVAEGVETSAQMRVLAAHGCDMAQGFLFGRPADPEEFAAAILRGGGRKSWRRGPTPTSRTSKRTRRTTPR
jgi:diguanylate cyclase (GGDEF)-like protein/PAS domain S-box-containing protein